VDTSGAATNAIDWSLASIASIGYVGTNGANGAPGSNGSNGAQGASAVLCYCLVDGNSLAAVPAFYAAAANGLPATGTWGEARAWQTSIPAPAAGQAVFQSNGIYNPVSNQTVWQTPYLSSLKVGNLSALSANTGDLTVSGKMSSANGNFQVMSDGTVLMQSAASGRRTVITAAGITVYDANNVARAFMGTS
jgi:hypothetical protein